ncbi:lipopolysaccharide assembly protein LapB [Lacinutrix sp. 5H-3-7-4]|uniref:tetratricopeptide repeat protein n=1 Tax=Lacinutrix sp. (strain 5H-3-7-4) TaxID=983544 RepID=UPI00020A3495|nr:tetratricopeptide repeat protein [Lacinutrix sp. 5H-3-7-4]AEH01363.1 Tetratricopeptide TPR_2 repeat-containing protein [Lacinutrix sp. 5H-3-7-4]
MKRLLFLLILFPFFTIAQSLVSKAELMIDNKQFTKAETTLIPFVKQNPENLKAIELLGDALGHQKKWDDAAAQFKKLIEQKPNTANYHYKYGGALGMKALTVSKISALMIIGDIKSSFLKAVQLDPKHIDAHWALVELYIQLPGIVGGSKSKSLKYANALQNISKVDGYLAKGYIYEYDNEPELAEEFYKKAIQTGGSVTCYDKLTKLYEKEGKTNLAISNLEAANLKHKRNAMHYQIGKVCADYNVQLEKGEFCLKIYLKNYSAKDGVPKAWAYYRLAQIYKHKNNKTEALKWIDKAIVNLPKIEVFKTEKQKINML